MADFNSKYSGEQVEEFLDQIANGEIGGGGVETETDPIFSASPAASITEEKKTEWDNKQDSIEDLDAIRSGAALGNTALQSIPDEYVIEDELMWTKAEGEAGVRLKGTNGTATGNQAISAGDNKTASDGTVYTSAASGDHAVVFGFGNTCAGRSTLAQGLYNTVNGKDSVAFGQRNTVNGDQAFAAGQQNEVATRLGVALGYQNKATNTNSIAIGYKNTSGGSGSVALGDTCESNGTSSTAMGYKTKATGAYSATFGENTQATNNGEVAMGVFNKSTTSTDTSEQTAFSFGIGTSDSNRLNALEIKKNGDVYIGDKSLAKVATSGSYNDLSNKPTIPTAVTESTVSGWGFTKNTGTYSKPSSGIPASDLAPDVFLQGEKGDKGDKGDTGATGPQGVSVTSVAQTTTSSADGGSNVVTVTLSDGKTSTFTVKNGSKGSQGEKGDKGDTGSEGPQGVQGIQGIQGPKGDIGADGAQGPKGDQGEQGPKGDKGDKGDTGATGANGTNGKDGVSVSSVKQTTTSTADGGTNVVTVTLSNGTTSTFNVKNGSKGSNGTNGTNGTNGKDGTNGATFTPSVDSAGNLSWTNNGGLTNPPTVNIKGPKGDKGDAGSGGSGGGSGAYAEVNHGTSDTTFTLTPNTFHVWDEVTSLTLTLGSETSGVANEFIFQFTSGATATSLTLPDDIKWANDFTPTIDDNKIYQISILNGLAVFLEFNNKVELVDNKLTITDGMMDTTFTFQYPVASDVTIIVNASGLGANNSSITIPKGYQTSTKSFGPGNTTTLVGIVPANDNIYRYI